MVERDRGGSVARDLWHVTMSLDGFIAGPDDAMDWVFEYPKANTTAGEVIRTTGALVVGQSGQLTDLRFRVVK